MNKDAELLLTHTIENVLEDDKIQAAQNGGHLLITENDEAILDWEVKSLDDYSDLIKEIINAHSRGKISSVEYQLLDPFTFKTVEAKPSSPIFFLAILKKLRDTLDLTEGSSEKIDIFFKDIVNHIEVHVLPQAESLIENYDDWYEDYVDSCIEDDGWFEEERSAQDYEAAEEYLSNDDNYLMGFDEWDVMFEEWKKGILILGWIGTLQSIRILRNVTLQKSDSVHSGRNLGAGYHVPYDTVTAFCFSLNTAIDNLSKKDKEAERLERVKENTSIKYPLSEDAFIDLLDRNSKGKSKKKRQPGEWRSIRRRGNYGIYFCPFCGDDFDESELDDDFPEFGCEGCREQKSDDERHAKEKAKYEESRKKARGAAKKAFHDLMGDEYEKYLRNIDEWDTKRKKWKGQKIMDKASKDIANRRKTLDKKFGGLIEKLKTSPFDENQITTTGFFYLELCYTKEQNELFQPLRNPFNLTKEEFNRIVEDRDVIMNIINDPCTSEDLIENVSSPQTRWLVACIFLEFSFILDIHDQDLTIESMVHNNLNPFWNLMEDYSEIITEKDICEWIKIQPFLPPLFSVCIGKNLYNFILKTFKDKGASDILKKNCKMITTFFEEPEVAERIFGKIR